MWFEVWNTECNVFDIQRCFPPAALVWNDPLCCNGVLRWWGGCGCLALGRFSHSQINQEQTETLRRGWGRHCLTPPLCCEIILKPASLQWELCFRSMSRSPGRESVQLIDVYKKVFFFSFLGKFYVVFWVFCTFQGTYNAFTHRFVTTEIILHRSLRTFTLNDWLHFALCSSHIYRSSSTPCTSISLAFMSSGRTSAVNCLQTNQCPVGKELRPSASLRQSLPPSLLIRTSRYSALILSP